MSLPGLSQEQSSHPMLPSGGRMFVFAVAAMTALAAPFATSATPVTYKFDSNATLESTSGIVVFGPVPITGSFTIDLASNQESNVTISFPPSSAIGVTFGPTSDVLLSGPFGSKPNHVIHACLE